VRGTFTIAIVATAVVSAPSPVAAQKATFVDGLVALTTALSGRYGDEGAQARAAVDTMSRALAEWDRSLQESEAVLAAKLPTASSSLALEMHTAMGGLYLERGRPGDALREFQSASSLAPKNPAFHLFQALIHESATKPADALESFRRAWELERDDPVKSYLLAERELDAGRTEAAQQPVAILSAAAGLVATHQYHVRLRPFVSISLLQDEASSTPLFAPAIYQQAYALIEQGAYGDALTAFRSALHDDPLLAGELTAHMSQGADALRQGYIADARVHFASEIGERPQSSEPHRLMAVTYWATTDYDKSIEHLEQAIRLNPADERSRILLAKVLTEAGQPERAEQTLIETARVLPASALARWRLGRLYESARRDQEAVRELETGAALSVLVGKAELYREIGTVHMRLLDADAAAHAFWKRIRLTPNDAVAHRERGRALLLGGHQEEALIEFAAALLVDPDDADACLAIGQIHLAAGQYADAAPVLERAVTLDGDVAEARYALGTALLRLARQDEGTKQLEEFHRLQAKAVEDQRRRIEIGLLKQEAATRTREGAHDPAAALWQAVVAAQPGVASNHVELAAALARGGKLAAAVAEYEKAIVLDPAPETYRQLAALDDRMGRRDDGIRTRATLLQLQEEALRGDSAAP
jgi:tetratricopeptide (TPR) repeat protein